MKPAAAGCTIDSISTTAEAAPRGHYLFLDGLRGAAAAYVMVYHLLAWVPSAFPRWVTVLQRPVSFGHVAVSVFIVLSGYSLGLPIARSPDRRLRGGMGGYLRRRARRILPAYFVALTISIVAVAGVSRGEISPAIPSPDLSAGSIATHVLLVHNLSRRYANTINMAHWSVAAEWQIYFLFPLILIPAWRTGGRLGLIAVGFAVAALPLALLPANRDLSWTCPWYVGLFAVGAAASTFERQRMSVTANYALLLAVAIMAGVYQVIHHAYYRPGQEQPLVEFAKDSLAGTMVAVLLVCAVSSCNFPPNSIVFWPKVRGWLESPILRWLGARSYSLYLIHCTILSLCLAMAARYQLGSMGSLAIRAFIGVPGSLAAAAAMYSTCEHPFLRQREVTS